MAQWGTRSVDDEDPWCPYVGLEDGHRLARLHQQGLVIAQASESGDDGVIALPIAGRLAGAAIDDQLTGLLRHLGIEVVHQHA